MSETETTVGVSTSVESPLVSGALLGLALAVVERFLVPFELTTLALGLVVVGAIFTQFGDRSSVDVGRALTALGATGFVALQILVLVFG